MNLTKKNLMGQSRIFPNSSPLEIENLQYDYEQEKIQVPTVNCLNMSNSKIFDGTKEN